MSEKLKAQRPFSAGNSRDARSDDFQDIRRWHRPKEGGQFVSGSGEFNRIRLAINIDDSAPEDVDQPLDLFPFGTLGSYF